jgi:Bacterial RNA polymerase, alpha chain C terminal domain
MARISLYIPDELRARMDAAGTEINWSEVARPSLTAAVAAVEHRKGQNMSTAIDRLRASKRQFDQQEKTSGYNAGRSWAENKAEYKELVRLQRERKDRPEETPEDAFNRAVDPSSAREITTWPSDRYGSAFVEGALKFFSEVRPEVERPELAFTPALLKRVDELELSVRSANCLKNDDIVYAGDLVKKTEAEMLRTPNFGRWSLNEIKQILAQMGLHLGMEVPGWPPENIEELAKQFEDHC